MYRVVCLLLMVAAIAAGCFLTLGSFDHGQSCHSAPASIQAKVEYSPGAWGDGRANRTCPDGQCCQDGQCKLRHSAPQPPSKVQVEVSQAEQDANPPRHPLAIPLLVLALVFIVGGGAYYAGWFTH
jgi:hypothetical protein